MRIKNVFIGSAILLSASINAQNSITDTMTQAVMEVYAEELAKNPSDYNILFSRANEYFKHGEFLRALDDVNMALKYTTRDDKEVLYEEYMLRANIYENRKEYELQLADLNEAAKLELSPLVQTKRAEANMNLGNYAAAKADYQSLLSKNSIDYNALSGLANVAIKENNYGLAKDYVNRGVAMYPAQSNVYIARAEVLNKIGDYNEAAHDLITAVTMDYENSRAIQLLVKMSDSRYDDVINALNDAIERASTSGILYYLRSFVAMSHFHYAAALQDINRIINNKYYNNDGIYYDCADVNFQLGRFSDAYSNIVEAIQINPTVPGYFILKARIQLALNKPVEAMKDLNSVLAVDKNNIQALVEIAKVDISQKKYDAALKELNSAIINNSEVPYNYILRGWLQKEFLNNPAGAKSDFSAVLNLDQEGLFSYKGFALHFLGRDSEAKKWMSDIITKSNIAGGEVYYYAAILYSLCDDSVKALEYLENALANGYGSYYNIMLNNEGVLNLSKLRMLSQFKSLVEKYKSNF
jgi:peptidase C14 caspase catalytic subunit p20